MSAVGPTENINVDHSTPADLLELFEVLEWQKAVEAQKGDIEE